MPSEALAALAVFMIYAIAVLLVQFIYWDDGEAKK